MALSIKDFIEIEKLAKDGLGEVYAATQVSFNRKVIIKKIAQRLFSNQHQIEQFVIRARLLASLNHDNIVQVYDFGQDKDAFYFILEYIDGTDLENLFSWKPFPWQIGLLIAVEALKGLNFAHKKGLAHSDFNSNNILVSTTGQVKVDFGLAQPGSQALFQNKEDKRFITAAYYMSPEVAKRIEEVGPSSNELLETTAKSMLVKENHELEGKDISRDIWSAGVLLHRIFCGKLPFSGETILELAQSIANSKEPIFFHFMPFLPDDCANAINACLAKGPQNRPSSLDPLIKSLEILISEIGFRDFNKEIQKYMVDKYTAINELEKLLLEYHSRMANECRQSGDAFKEAAHVAEIEKLGQDGNGVIRPNSITPPDLPDTIQAANFFVPEKTGPKKPRALKITIAISVIILAFLGFGISFIMLQKNGVTGDEERTYLQKAEMAVPQTSQSPVKSVTLPDSPGPVRAPAMAPVLRKQNFLPKETVTSHSPGRKSNGLAKIRKKTDITPDTRPAPDKSAILKVNVKPLAAIVSLDGKEVSLQDITSGKSIAPGQHAIAANASGYESYHSVFTIEPDVTQVMDISLRQTEKGAGFLHVYSYPWAELYVDGVLQGTTPTPKPVSLMEGEHDLQLRRQGYKTHSETVSVVKGQVTHVQVDLEKLESSGN